MTQYIHGLTYGIILGIIIGRQFLLRSHVEKIEDENRKMKNWIGLDRCGDCIACEYEIDTSCPFSGEPGGCNNRDCAGCYKKMKGK